MHNHSAGDNTLGAPYMMNDHTHTPELGGKVYHAHTKKKTMRSNHFISETVHITS